MEYFDKSWANMSTINFASDTLEKTLVKRDHNDVSSLKIYRDEANKLDRSARCTQVSSGGRMDRSIPN